MKVVKHCNSIHSAYIIRGVLESEGIKAVILNENINFYLPQGCTIMSLQVQVAVSKQNFMKAVEVLKYLDDSTNETHCPYCKSKDIKYRFPSENSILVVFRVIFFLFAITSGSPIGNVRRVNYCKTCFNEFSDN